MIALAAPPKFRKISAKDKEIRENKLPCPRLSFIQFLGEYGEYLPSRHPRGVMDEKEKLTAVVTQHCAPIADEERNLKYGVGNSDFHANEIEKKIAFGTEHSLRGALRVKAVDNDKMYRVYFGNEDATLLVQKRQ